MQWLWECGVKMWYILSTTYRVIRQYTRIRPLGPHNVTGSVTKKCDASATNRVREKQKLIYARLSYRVDVWGVGVGGGEVQSHNNSEAAVSVFKQRGKQSYLLWVRSCETVLEQNLRVVRPPNLKLQVFTIGHVMKQEHSYRLMYHSLNKDRKERNKQARKVRISGGGGTPSN